jgi:hypothetical protein
MSKPHPSDTIQVPWHSFWTGFRTVLLAGLFLLTVQGMRPDPGKNDTPALGLAHDHLFDFAAWEVGALADKTANGLIAPEAAMSADERVAYVRDYLALVKKIQGLDEQIQELYVDPSIQDPAAASSALRAERDPLRQQQQQRQALAEAIIQSQVSEMLVEYGFGVGGEVLPPVSIRFTQLPTILIISRRDRIERTGAYPLENGITVDQMEALENDLDQKLDSSSLVAPLGGLAVYPAMLIETSYTPNVYEISAHEWTHHYLSFFPLGINYGLTSDLYTMNETTASIVGSEIGWAVLHRYYPDMAGPPPDYSPPPPTPPAPPPQIGPQPPAKPEFDFREEMHITRLHVDELLGEGKIAEAEDYMEARRVIFVAHGYHIRKLNQAYFAFYGSYADEPGATGADPVGPALRELRTYSPSLVDFIAQVRGITTLAELEALVSRARQSQASGQ